MLKRLFKRIKKEVRFFVSIGAGENQLPLINAAKQLGLSVIAVDQDSDAPGFLSADIRIQESIEDIGEIYTKLQELLLNGIIVAIMTRSYGNAAITVADLCEKTGLSNLPAVRIRDLVSKKKMKQLLMKHGLRIPKSLPISKSRKNNIDFPVVGKPVSGHAKIGVLKLNNMESLQKYLKNHKEDVIIEEFIPGDELIAFGIVSNGRFYLYEITDKVISDSSGFIDIAHIAPSKYVSRYSEIKAIGQSIADAAEISNAPLFFEMMIAGNNNIYVIETAPEFGGEMIADALIPVSTGTNIFKDAVLSAITPNHQLVKTRQSGSSAVVRYIIAEKNGILESYKSLPAKLPGLVHYRMQADIGDMVMKPMSNLDRLGVIIVKAPTREKAVELSEDYIRKMELIIK